MIFFRGVVLPILLGTVFLILWIIQGSYNKRKIVKYINFFIPIVGAPLEFKTFWEHYYYEAVGHFQNREAFVTTGGFVIFRKKLSIDVAVQLRNYRLRPFQKGFLGGTPFQYEGKKYLIGGKYFITMAYNKLTRSIKIANMDDETFGLVKNEFQALCVLADKIDSGEIKYDFLILRK